MRRYYISPIIGDGLSPETAFRARVEIHLVSGDSSSTEIKSDPVTGVPTVPWALSIVSSTNHANILSDNSIDALPDVPLDMKVSSIHTPTKNAMIARLNARGIDTSFIGAQDGFRETVRTLGQLLRADFDENKFNTPQ